MALKQALIDGLYATAKKAALAHKNQVADEVAKRVGPKHKHISDNYTNENDVIIRVDDNQGNSRTYALRRLAKDRPDLHAQCLAGEMTANAAMVQAGFRKPPQELARTPGAEGRQRGSHPRDLPGLWCANDCV
jgi:hypothetical protein